MWKTDGTEAGTELVKDINPGSGSTFSTDTPIINFNNELYFIKGTTLWKSDGTNIGTVEVKDLEANVKRVLVFNSKLHIFNYGNSFWVSDGTNVGTTKIEVPINEFWHNGEFEVVNDKLFFQGNNDCGYEIWVTDGTANGTMLLKDIHPSFDDNNIEDIVELNGKAIFTASDSNWKKKEIYFSDGTKNGTSLLKDINKEGNNSSSPQNHFTFGNKVLFSADNGEFGRELWVIDGASTLMLKDINSGHLHSNPSNFIEFNGSVYFSASTKEKGKELWKTDGTKAGTVLIKDINPGTKDGLSTGDIVSLNNKMYFFGNNGNSGVELFESDGTEAGTKIVVNINNTSVNSISNVNELVVLNNELFFIANNGTSGSELFKSDGTEAGTVLVKDINTNGSSYAGNLNVHPYLNKLYFSAYNGSGTFLWESDGTSTNTYQQSVKNPSNFKLSGSRDIGDRAQSNIIYNTELYFSGESTSNFNKKGVELWAVTYSGTIQEVFDINPGTLSSSPANLTDHKGQLYFSAKTATNGKELWKAIGVSHAELVKDMISGTSNSNFLDIGSFGNNILFATGNNGSNLELWKSDGTEAGTILLQDINPSTEQYGNGSSPKNFFVHDNKLYFSANDSTVGEELWVLEESALSVKKENLNLFSKMSVYPNPTSETLNFKIDNQLIKSVRIYSILGKEVMKKTNKFGIENINITNLSSGLYLLQINTETGVFTKRIVKK